MKETVCSDDAGRRAGLAAHRESHERAKAILAVKTGKPSTEAAQETGYKSGDSVCHLVERFNERGLAALLIAPGRGCKETSTLEQRKRIMQEFGRPPTEKRIRQRRGH